MCVSVGQGPRTAAYALCIVNEHAEGPHNGRSAPQNASVSKSAGQRSRLALCAAAEDGDKQGDL